MSKNYLACQPVNRFAKVSSTKISIPTVSEAALAPSPRSYAGGHSSALMLELYARTESYVGGRGSRCEVTLTRILRQWRGYVGTWGHMQASKMCL